MTQPGDPGQQWPPHNPPPDSPWAPRLQGPAPQGGDPDETTTFHRPQYPPAADPDPAPAPASEPARYQPPQYPTSQYPTSQYPPAQYPTSQYPPAQYPPPQYQQPAYQQPGQYPQQPHYGGYQEPNYAQPPVPPEPSAKSRVGLFAAIGVIVVLAVVAVAVVIVKPSFLGFRKVFDGAAVARTIESQSAGRYQNVNCPSNEKVKRAATFQCTASDGTKLTITVTDESSAAYTWSPS